MRKIHTLLTISIFMASVSFTFAQDRVTANKEIENIKHREKSDVDKAYKKAQDDAEKARKDAVQAKKDAQKAQQKADEAQQKADAAEHDIQDKIDKANEQADIQVDRIHERAQMEIKRVNVKYNISETDSY